MPASAASRIASAANAGGTKIIVAFGAGLAHRLGDGVEDRHASSTVLAALAGRDAADDRACRTRGTGRVWNSPVVAGDALDR